MSFQDVGKPGTPAAAPTGWTPTPAASAPASHIPTMSDPFRQVSDWILQYQRNVGILEKIVRQVGTNADGPELVTQYDVQVDVLKQLGERLQKLLREQEASLDKIPRNEANKRRATHLKLTRDFQRVEGTFRNLILDTRRKRARIEEEKQQVFKKAPTAGAPDEEKMALELQLQQERLNEEIMREREEEIRNINRGMHQVNEIYKDLANIVGSQQEQVDQIETHMEESKVNAERGLEHIHKANERASQSQCTIS